MRLVEQAEEQLDDRVEESCHVRHARAQSTAGGPTTSTGGTVTVAVSARHSGGPGSTGTTGRGTSGTHDRDVGSGSVGSVARHYDHRSRVGSRGVGGGGGARPSCYHRRVGDCGVGDGGVGANHRGYGDPPGDRRRQRRGHLQRRLEKMKRLHFGQTVKSFGFIHSHSFTWQSSTRGHPCTLSATNPAL